MFLTPEELVELTGRQRVKHQIAALKAAEIPYILSADGDPRVLRAEIERRLSSETHRQSASAPKVRRLEVVR